MFVVGVCVVGVCTCMCGVFLHVRVCVCCGCECACMCGVFLCVRVCLCVVLSLLLLVDFKITHRDTSGCELVF